MWRPARPACLTLVVRHATGHRPTNIPPPPRSANRYTVGNIGRQILVGGQLYPRLGALAQPLLLRFYGLLGEASRNRFWRPGEHAGEALAHIQEFAARLCPDSTSELCRSQMTRRPGGPLSAALSLVPSPPWPINQPPASLITSRLACASICERVS